MPSTTPIVTTVNTVNVTYSPTGIDSNQVASFRDRTLQKLSLQPVLTVGLEEPKAGGRKTTKGSVKLTIPREVAAISASSPATIDNDLVKFEMLTGAGAETSDREIALDRFLECLQNPSVRAVLVNPEHFW